MARLRSYLLLTLVTGVLVGWAAAIDSGRLFDSWAFFHDTESDAGNTIAAATLGTPALTDLAVNSATEPGSVTLTWTPASDASTQVEIFRASGASTCGAFPASPLDTVSRTPASYTDSGLVAGVYCYKVRGKLNGWTSAFSATKSATISSPILDKDLFLTTGATLVDAAPSPGTVSIDAKAQEPFDFRVWQRTGVKVVGGQDWTLTLDLDTTTPFQSATLIAQLWLTTAGTCGTDPSGSDVVLASAPATTFFADGTLTLTGTGSGTAPGNLCFKLTNQGGNNNNGVAHRAKIVIGTSKIHGPWDPNPGGP